MKDVFALLPELLPPWYSGAKRDLPWRQTRDPYAIWVSEVMLQQTRVEAVLGYYRRFLAALPTVEALAAADDGLLHKLWEGLGYYSRVRNMKRAARFIAEECGGCFPDSYEALLALPGVGPYTAGAVASIAFGLPEPAVDGNVLRVTARLLAMEESVDLPPVRTEIRRRLAAVYPDGACGIFTQALMELGATVCLPNGAPRCAVCPMAGQCAAHRQGRETDFPVRAPKRQRRREDRTVFMLSCGGRYALERRPNAGLLAGLWQFPNAAGRLTPQEALEWAARAGLCPRELTRSLDRTHIFTHIQWDLRCYFIECGAAAEPFCWMTPDQIENRAALPTAFRMFWDTERVRLQDDEEETRHV